MTMFDDENMDKFIVEQRARLAHEKQALEKNPTSALSEYILDDEVKKKQPLIQNMAAQYNAGEFPAKENILKTKPPTPQLFKLGEAYKAHKEKLKEELRHDYRQALAEKQIRSTGVRGKMATSYEKGLAANDNDLGLSLPIRDHLSAKEKLRLERNREYNQFKAGKENQAKTMQSHLLKTYATPITYPQVAYNNEETQNVRPEQRVAESYEELLARKRDQERSYRHKAGPDEDVVKERKARRMDDGDEERLVGRKVAFPRRRRPRYVEYRYDDDDFDDDETEEELIERLRARRQRRRRAKMLVDDEYDDDVDDDMAFRRVNRKEDVAADQRRRGSVEAGGMTKNENDLRSRSAPPEQEFTGLLIGKVASANTVQRRKAEYKEDLTKQMEEDRQRKLREKLLDKQAGVVPSEKKAARSVRHREVKKVSKEESDDDKGKSSKRKGKKSSRRVVSSESDSDQERPHWRSRPPFPQYYNPSAMNGFHPPPVPSMSYPSIIDDAYYYYGSQNPLNPNMAPGGFPPPRSFPSGVSPLLAAAESKQSGMGEPMKDVDRRDSTLPAQARVAKPSEVRSSLVSDETRDAQKKKEMMQTYQEELREQMKIKEKKKLEEKREREVYNRKKEEEAANYDPWGKGGGGAPMKDTHGNLISDLRQMHQQNEELVRDPAKVVELAKQRQKMIENTEEIFYTPRKEDTETMLMSPRFGRNNPFEMKESVEQRTLKGTYKDELRKQIEEKKRLDAERKEQRKILEEKEERRMADDARKMQEEYENEQRKQREKIEEQQRKNEEIQRALTEKREEAERKRKEEQMKREEEERRMKERELDAKLKRQPATRPDAPDKAATPRPEPPPPTTAPKQTQSEMVRREVAVQARAPPSAPRSYTHTPAPSVRVDKSRESKRISRELSALRKQLLNEQQRIEDQLRTSDPHRRTETLVDLSRVRQRPVQVRRPPTVDRPNSKALREFTEFKDRHDDTTSLRMFRIQHPDTPSDTQALERQQEDLIKAQLMKIETLKNGMESPQKSLRRPREAEFTLLPPSESFTSLLDADTTYIPVPEEPVRVPSDGARKLSARERRRAKRGEEEGGQTYRATPDNYSVHSLNSLATLDIERMAGKNKGRMERLRLMQGDDTSLADPDDILDRFISQQKTSSAPETPDPLALRERRQRKGTSISAPHPDRPPSTTTVDSEPWMRPGTGPPATTT